MFSYLKTKCNICIRAEQSHVTFTKCAIRRLTSDTIISNSNRDVVDARDAYEVFVEESIWKTLGKQVSSLRTGMHWLRLGCVYAISDHL